MGPNEGNLVYSKKIEREICESTLNYFCAKSSQLVVFVTSVLYISVLRFLNRNIVSAHFSMIDDNYYCEREQECDLEFIVSKSL